MTKQAKKYMEAIGPIPCRVVIKEPIRKLRIDKHTPKEIQVIYRKINEIIENLA